MEGQPCSPCASPLHPQPCSPAVTPAPPVLQGAMWRVLPLKEFRNTPGVQFHLVPIDKIGTIHSIDRVFHAHSAQSPGPVGDVQRPWYYHQNQDDNLLVFHGERTTELYNSLTHSIETFLVTPNKIMKDGQVLYDGPAVLCWPAGTFHRVSSGPEGSMSENFAVHKSGWHVETNFSIYDLNLATGQSRVIRVGREDQLM
ncbi:hypothetical protein PAPYR_9314 [Paratrimastix pyriformis]|uniref:Uncharacterized protein n=1 Tax=Paratrimastix pyriformis TaxID=342808 RepID=A0ABQ8U8M2_9EUKA|nr:hypothetical protein PAPYR_9314 [Paratrimastix pyriformis]